MDILKRFTAIFIALSVMLTASGVCGIDVYAKVYTQNYTQSSVTSNQTVTSDFIRNYTKGMSISNYSSLITFKNDGVVNVSGGDFDTYIASFENNGTFSFIGSSATFSLGDRSVFTNNGTAAIKGVYNFGVQSGTSFINNGTLYLEDISYINLDGFVNKGTLIFPDSEKNSYVYLEFEKKNSETGQVYTKSDYENRTLNYPICYEGLNADNYSNYENPNPAYYEWAAADPQDVTLADPTLPGYEFLGWTCGELGISSPQKSLTFSSSVCENITVTANWKKAVYSISYDLDGGSFSDTQNPPAEYTRGDQKGIPSPNKNGYTFGGWIDTDTNEQVSTAGDSFYYMKPSTLGDKNYKASFIANSDTQYRVVCCYQNIDGTYKEESHLLTGETGTTVSVSGDAYGKEHFTFDSGNSGNVLSGTVKADNSLELKLYFDRNKYKVVFKSQDGSETFWETEKYYDDTVGEYGGDVPTKSSDDSLYTFVFDNWAREEPNRDFGYEASGVPVSGDITFYAAFKKVRDESVVIIKWEEAEGFIVPEQSEIRLSAGDTYTAELRLENEKYYIGTREWTFAAKEAHIYWNDPQTGDIAADYSLDKADFDSPVILTIPNVRHDTFIVLRAQYHDEHDYSQAYDTIISNGNCITDSVIRHFCYKCGKTEDETISANGHVTSSVYEKNDVSHWKICTICNNKVENSVHFPDKGAVTHEPTHSSTGTKTYTCTVCGYVTKREILEMISHAAEGGWQSGANTHYKVCSCGEILEESPHSPDNGTVTLEPTYDNEGKREYHCTVCGYITGETAIAPLGHNVENEWQRDVSGHWKNCECDEKHEFGGHISDGGLFTHEPTYEEWGERVFSCTVCGYVLSTETIPPLSHKPGSDWSFDENSHWKNGCGCGEIHEFSQHTSDTGTVIKYPTATEEGEKEYRCTVCGYIMNTEKIPPVPEEHTHVYGAAWIYDAASHWHACECGEKTDTASHISDGGTVTKQPTTTENGVRTFKCTVCGYVINTESIPAVGTPVIPPYVPSIPSNTTASAAVPASREPYIYNDDSKKGWEVISDIILSTPDGSAVKVNMNGTSELPKSILTAIQGKDADLVLDMGSGFVWTVNGMSVTKAKTVDMRVRKASKIPKSAIDEYFGDIKTIQIDLRHNGDFGFTAELTIDLGGRYDGMYANSYCYKARKFEFGDSTEILNGQAVLRFTHASSWLITIESSPVMEDVSSGAAAHSSGTPIDMSAPAGRGISIPAFDFEKKLRLSNKKRRYRILKKRRLDDLVFVL